MVDLELDISDRSAETWIVRAGVFIVVVLYSSQCRKSIVLDAVDPTSLGLLQKMSALIWSWHTRYALNMLLRPVNAQSLLCNLELSSRIAKAKKRQQPDQHSDSLRLGFLQCACVHSLRVIAEPVAIDHKRSVLSMVRLTRKASMYTPKVYA
jgi:hypothetical protein